MTLSRTEYVPDRFGTSGLVERPSDEDIDEYFEREVIPYNPNAWIDKKKTKPGYEIPFTRTFYEYKQIEPSDVIAARIEEHEKSLMAKLHDLFGGE